MFRAGWKQTASAIVLAALTAISARAQDSGTLSAGPTVRDVVILKGAQDITLTMRNVSNTLTVAARDIQVLSADPTLALEGRVECREGSVAVAMQAYLGNISLSAGKLLPIGSLGESHKVSFPGNQRNAEASLMITLPVTRKDGGEAVDLTFNPPRTFEQMLKDHIRSGGSAAAYLRQTQVIEQKIKLNLVGWCKASSQGAAAGDTYAGIRAHEITVRTLYEGDPKIPTDQD